MHKVYRINGMVDFYVDGNQLKSLISDETEMLNKPVSRCLLLLIENRYEIIEQATFFSEVWHKFGVSVTPNTFYQNISLLRRSLSAIGLGDDVVKTVSRKGLMLSQRVEIEFIADESHHPTEYLPASDAEVNSTAEPDARVASKRITRAGPGMAAAENIERKGEKKRYAKSFWLIAVLVCLTAASYPLYHANNRVSGYFDHYTDAGEYKGCRLFSNALAPKEKVMNIVNHDEVSCAENKYVYITTYDFSTVNSVVQCRSPLNDNHQDNHCVSHLFVAGGIKNETAE
ncbi:MULTISPECIES: winged helix-turn-helix domain-containing protein [unclassified Brenneria]|uniref:winged helix-turn-helix domain-containing protein n=1 Tax=unclassified Brenneria TaxID=2634434 RepID=UPI0029C56E39|nr:MULTISPECIES: winged helix-turn-helix domain-containing protein [unclassified Brenneria]MDX5629643.1 hypothetical protein [Brenneria sp. L3-3Z]MDX5696789.1 hypothetical protein [Brenneria sp. L4-2C]